MGGVQLMGFQLNRSPTLPTSVDTGAIADMVGTEYIYAYGKKNAAAAWEDLTCRVWYRTSWTPSTPRAVVVQPNTGSFSVTDSLDNAYNRSRAEFYVRCGMIFVLLKTRIQQNQPYEPGYAARGATTTLARSIDAICFDPVDGLQFVRSNPDRANWTCDPKFVLYGGGSSSGIMTTCSVIRRWPADFHITAMLNLITAFGADNALLGLNYVSHVRTELGHTEAQYTNSLPPMCHFSIARDDALSFTTVPTLQSLLNTRIAAKAAVDLKSIVHSDPNNPARNGFDGDGGDHWLEDVWEEPTLTGATTVEQAILNYAIAVFASETSYSGTIQT